MKNQIIKILFGVALVAVCATGCGKNQKNAAGEEISVVSREDGSGTRGAFIELFGIEEEDENGEKVDKTYEKAEITNSTSVMLTTVEGNKNAIGYVSLGALNDSVKAVKINGVEATQENIENKSYTISRPFNIVTKDGLSDVANDFMSFIMSKDGQAVVTEEKYISVSNEEFKSTMPEGKVTVAGSSSVTPLMEALKEAYLKVNKNATIDIQQNDSTTGVNSAIEGICDIGMASRELKDTEVAGGVKSTVIAMDGIAVVVNKDNAVDDLTADQVKSIFTGETTDWGKIK